MGREQTEKPYNGRKAHKPGITTEKIHHLHCQSSLNQLICPMFLSSLSHTFVACVGTHSKKY